MRQSTLRRQRGEENAPVEVAHEVLERRVVRVGQLVDVLVQSDLAQAVVLDFCPHLASAKVPRNIGKGGKSTHWLPRQSRSRGPK